METRDDAANPDTEAKQTQRHAVLDAASCIEGRTGSPVAIPRNPHGGGGRAQETGTSPGIYRVFRKRLTDDIRLPSCSLAFHRGNTNVKKIALLLAIGACCATADVSAFPLGHPANTDRQAPAARSILPVQYAARYFRFPRIHGEIVDWCASWATSCGWGGANLYCRSRGFERAHNWNVFHPGSTYVIGSSRVCQGDFCKGFRSISCF